VGPLQRSAAGRPRAVTAAEARTRRATRPLAPGTRGTSAMSLIHAKC
jgi:hypothetical protein